MSKFETSLATGPHQELSKLIGEWTGTSSVWFEPGDPTDVAPIEGTFRSLLDGRYVIHEYKSSMKGKVLEGLAIYGYHIDLKRYQSAWIDSFHTGLAIMFSEGERGSTKNAVTGSYAYVTPELEQHWGWRTELEFVNDNEVVITAYNISPDGHEDIATQIKYNRK